MQYSHNKGNLFCLDYIKAIVSYKLFDLKIIALDKLLSSFRRNLRGKEFVPKCPILDQPLIYNKSHKKFP